MANYTSPPSFSASHTTITSTASSTTSIPPEISPSSLDTLPLLAAILSRLQTTPSIGLITGSSPHPSQAQTQTQTQATTSSPSFQALSSSTKDFSNTFSTTPLTTKDIPAATDALKHRLQKTRMQVSQLPDMNREIAEQEDEIRKLEERIKEQRRVLEKLKAMGGG